MADTLGLLGVVTPAQREHVAVALEHDGLPPAFLKRLLGDHQMAYRDLLPVARQVRRRATGGRAGRARGPTCRRARWLGVSVRCRREQLVVEVAANERHEGSAGGMNPANRQPSSKLGDLWIVARKNSKLQLASGLDCANAAPNRAPFGLPRLSMPNKTTGAG